MSTIIDTDGLMPTPPVVRGAPTRNIPTAPAARAEESDRVELSRFGRELADAMQTSSLRLARTQAIRVEIENHTYETPERLSGTADRLLDVIG